jgi:hypothetical protein
MTECKILNGQFFCGKDALSMGDSCVYGRLVWTGHWGGKSIAVLERFQGEESFIIIFDNGKLTEYKKYGPGIPDGADSSKQLYFGLSADQVLDSGHDLLGEKLLGTGNQPSMAAIKGILPPLEKNAYCFLSGGAGWSGFTVSLDGAVYPQLSGLAWQPSPLFSPMELDIELGKVKPVMTFLCGHIPILISRYRQNSRIMETQMFVEYGDPDRDPLLWVRVIFYKEGNELFESERCIALSISRNPSRKIIDRSTYWDSFIETAASWNRVSDQTAKVDIPEWELALSVKGCLNSLYATFSGDHPHYGHRGYGSELHDHFPPIIITAIETLAAWGHLSKARRIAEHVLTYAIGPSGRFIYRQGQDELFGASASEYGQLLWILNRFSDALDLPGWILPYLETIRKMGNYLIENRSENDILPGLRLIRMCAEADTNGRINDYIQNSLWAVNGLRAIALLLQKYGMDGDFYAQEAESLLLDAQKAILARTMDSRLGRIPPFQIQYDSIPQSLSSCRDTLLPMDDSAFQEYLKLSDMRKDFGGKQDYFENIYANYRYYQEMLSSGLLKKEDQDALVCLRSELGGEILGMCRFLGWIDDWPVFNYARFLLETDRIDRYLLLLYAHTEYHGLRHLSVYYEQVGIDGSVRGHDCVPSLLITPLLTAWMLAFEPVDHASIHLLRAVPRSWYKTGFSFKGIQISHGPISISVIPDDHNVVFTFELPALPEEKEILLTLSAFDSPQLLSGDAYGIITEDKRLRLFPKAVSGKAFTLVLTGLGAMA